MKRTSIKLSATMLLAGLYMLLPHNPFCSYCGQAEQHITIFYTNDLQGNLEPCG